MPAETLHWVAFEKLCAPFCPVNEWFQAGRHAPGIALWQRQNLYRAKMVKAKFCFVFKSGILGGSLFCLQNVVETSKTKKH